MTNLLAFSTLGCPGWDLDRTLAAAQEYGYDAVEIRGYLDSLDLPTAEPYTPQNRTVTKQRFADAGIAISCVSSSGIVTKDSRDHVRTHTELAHDLGCPFVRVFGGNLPPDLAPEEGRKRAAESLHAFGEIAQDAGVQIVLETHDAFSTGEGVAKLIQAADHPAIFALWDIHHTYRQNEPVETSLEYLAPYLKHVHIKDSKSTGEYTFLGEGDIPVFPMLGVILNSGYTGAISFEWEKRWHPEIPDPSLVFPQYASLIRPYLASH